MWSRAEWQRSDCYVPNINVGKIKTKGEKLEQAIYGLLTGVYIIQVILYFAELTLDKDFRTMDFIKNYIPFYFVYKTIKDKI